MFPSLAMREGYSERDVLSKNARNSAAALHSAVFTPRTLIRRIMLVQGDRSIAGGGAQRHGRAKPADDAGGGARFHPFLEEALTFAKFEPAMYETVRTFCPAGEEFQDIPPS